MSSRGAWKRLFCSGGSSPSPNEEVRVAIEYVDISGSEDDPCVEIHAQFHFLTHPMMLVRAFPGAESNSELMKIFGRKQLVIPVVSRFQFTPEGKIRFEDVNANIIAGYMNAGVSLDDIADLMRYSVISAKSTMQQDTAVPEPNAVALEVIDDDNNALDDPGVIDTIDPADEDNREPHPHDNVHDEKESGPRDKLSVEYLLSSEP
ncbi:hypothetical protein Poli38472_011274 [Pythium oligandrum]|uniref:Uncharacterized protein n=1 Tax=Pythium oligandrum TaxID=41045 RepID=A0A8K1CR03_PYTOL|nr:hypothetical protein Poli38472_011274 [Pythium oligandrum]|eukprot:TMW67654.1 hypothetical protein Poli38472_011274 [Pythium oligandrum]